MAVLLARRAARQCGERDDFCTNAIYRGLELLDLTIAGPRHRRRLKELVRLRETPLDYFFGPNEFGSSDSAWGRYFGAFGMAAARHSALFMLLPLLSHLHAETVR